MAAKKKTLKSAGAPRASARKAAAKPGKKSPTKGKSQPSGNKTLPNANGVEAFLAALPRPRQQECRAVAAVMAQASGEEPRMWGSSIVGFGSHRLVYESGREVDFFLVGFSPRKKNLTLYLTAGFESHGALLEKLGTFTTGKSCLYLASLEDVDAAVLKKLVQQSVKDARAMT